MQKYLYIIVLSALMAACGSGAKNGNPGEKKILSVTIEPQHYFLDQIVGDAFAINTLVPPGTSPETYEPAPSVMVDLAKSEIYFMVGDLGFENAWSKRLAENNPDVRVVNCSEGIDWMEGHVHDHDHGHVHDHGDAHSHDTDEGDHHNQDEEHYEHAHSHSGVDPHVWSSPKAVKVVVRNMLEAVVKSDPENGEAYRAGYDGLLLKIEGTDSLIRDLLKDAPSRAFIIYHPSLGYFARDYGLHQLSIEFEGKSPSPSQIKELVDVARRENIRTIFVERSFDTKNAEVLAKEIGGKVFEIDPFRYEWDEELLRIASILAGKTDE